MKFKRGVLWLISDYNIILMALVNSLRTMYNMKYNLQLSLQVFTTDFTDNVCLYTLFHLNER